MNLHYATDDGRLVGISEGNAMISQSSCYGQLAKDRPDCAFEVQACRGTVDARIIDALRTDHLRSSRDPGAR
jgi:hypothetical protein